MKSTINHLMIGLSVLAYLEKKKANVNGGMNTPMVAGKEF